MKNNKRTIQEYFEHRQWLIAAVRDAFGDPDWHPGRTGELALLQSFVEDPDFRMTEKTARTLAQIDAALGDDLEAILNPFVQEETVSLDL